MVDSSFLCYGATTPALLQRATATLCTLIDPQAGYNSRSPAESDCHALYSYRPTGRLQLPLSCGERHENKTACFRPILLQLTLSPAESDVNKLLLPANDIATTPALLRRATVIDDFAVHSNAATTPALLRRATAQCKLFHGKTQSYNSRSPAESDSIIIVRPSHIVRYNSRSPAESDPARR